MNCRTLYLKVINSKKVKQVGLLYIVNIVGIPIGIITSIIVTRYLGAQVYGDYKFVISLFALATLL